MSRTLTRLRNATGDPLLVRAGRGLVPTPRAIELRDVVHALVRDVRMVLKPPTGEINMAELDRVFTIRASEGFVEMFCGPLVADIASAAPRVRLRFAPKPDKNAEAATRGADRPRNRRTRCFRTRNAHAPHLPRPVRRSGENGASAALGRDHA
nr:hypothetical protein [Sphingomonas sp. H160509]